MKKEKSLDLFAAAKEYPLVSWNLFGVIFLFISWPVSVLLFVISIYYYLKQSTAKNEENKNSIIEEANKFVSEIKFNKKLRPIATSFLLDKSEEAFLEEDVRLAETRAVRHTSGSGVGFRVMKGVSVGGFQSKGESKQEWRVIDEGKLVLTNKRLLFRGSEENREIQLGKIIGTEITLESIQVVSTSKKKNSIFSIRNPYILAALINILKRADDSSDLSKIDLDIQFK